MRVCLERHRTAGKLTHAAYPALVAVELVLPYVVVEQIAHSTEIRSKLGLCVGRGGEQEQEVRAGATLSQSSRHVDRATRGAAKCAELVVRTKIIEEAEHKHIL